MTPDASIRDVHWSQLCLGKGYISEVSQCETVHGRNPAKRLDVARIYSHIWGQRLF